MDLQSLHHYSAVMLANKSVNFHPSQKYSALQDYSVSPSPFPLDFEFRIWDLDLGPGFGTWDVALGHPPELVPVPAGADDLPKVNIHEGVAANEVAVVNLTILELHQHGMVLTSEPF